MTGQVGESDAMAFWLTLRICQKLVKAIGDFIEKSATVPAGSDRELVLSFKQSAAMVRKEHNDPVVAGGKVGISLVDRVDVTHRKDAILLNFFIPDGGSAQLSLSIQGAQQWLGILRTHYQQAGWPLDGWPSWMAGATDKPTGARHSVH